MTESPAELLEKAAVRLEELAKHFQGYVDNFDENANWPNGKARFDSPADSWHYDNTDRFGGGGDWIRAMSPAVAAPLVAWLRHTAEEGGLVAPYYEYVKAAQDALDFARLIVGEQ